MPTEKFSEDEKRMSFLTYIGKEINMYEIFEKSCWLILISKLGTPPDGAVGVFENLYQQMNAIKVADGIKVSKFY